MSRGRATTRSRRATLYVATLGCALLISVIGVSALMAVRASHRMAMGELHFADARNMAQAAIDYGMYAIQNQKAWRTARANGIWFNQMACGPGRFTLYGVDPVDGDLTDDPRDPLIFTGVGLVGDARYLLEVRLRPEDEPLDPLATCLHAGGNIYVGSTATVRVYSAPLSANGNVSIDGGIIGNVEANAVDRPAHVVGTVTAPSPAKNMPAAGVVDQYKAVATQIPYTATISKAVLSRASNPFGVPNGEGVYFMDTNGSDVAIQLSRLHGTLVVETRGGRVRITDQVLFQPYRADYAVLVVNGDLDLVQQGAALGELLVGNFNPPGTPYQNETDTDTLDIYPNEIHGLIYVTGSLLVGNQPVVRGSVIVGTSVNATGDLTVHHSPALITSPPMGFTQISVPKVVPGSWRRVLDPPF